MRITAPFLIVAPLVCLAALAWLRWDWLTAQFYVWHMESDSRKERLQVDRVVDCLSLKPGQAVADIGAGSGLFTFPLAQAVGPAGKVFAVDLNPELTRKLEESSRARGLSNIAVILAQPSDPGLPRPVDLIFICDVLHHVEDRAAYIRTLSRRLKVQGRLAVLDFKKKGSLFHAMQFTPEQLDGWAESAALEVEAAPDFLEEEFFRVYRK